MSNRLSLYNGNTTNSILQTKYPATEKLDCMLKKAYKAIVHLTVWKLSLYIIRYTYYLPYTWANDM